MHEQNVAVLACQRESLAVDDSTIRKFLKGEGCRWVSRAQKRKYTGPEMEVRQAFAIRVLRMSRAELRKELGLSLDGVVLSMPPAGDVARWNHCMSAETHMWRKPSEAALPELAGDDPCPDQVALERAIPLWAGISEGGGCGPVLFHSRKKCSVEEWARAIKGGSMGAPLRKLNPRNKGRPLRVLCDGEGFLHSQGRAGGVPAAFHLVMEDAAPKSGLEPRREVLVVASQGTAAARFADYRQKKACLTKAQYIAA